MKGEHSTIQELRKLHEAVLQARSGSPIKVTIQLKDSTLELEAHDIFPDSTKAFREAIDRALKDRITVVTGNMLEAVKYTP